MNGLRSSGAKLRGLQEDESSGQPLWLPYGLSAAISESPVLDYIWMMWKLGNVKIFVCNRSYFFNHNASISQP
jgi:hypothetical protein